MKNFSSDIPSYDDTDSLDNSDEPIVRLAPQFQFNQLPYVDTIPNNIDILDNVINKALNLKISFV